MSLANILKENGDAKVYNVGDIVLVRKGQKTRFFEVVKAEEDYVWISDGYVQIRRFFDEIQLICKSGNRKDEKVPTLKYYK